MLKNELITRKQKQEKQNEDFNKIWYSGLKECIMEHILDLMDSDFPIFKFNYPAYMYQYKCSFSDDEIFVLLRSKLWNEGINLFMSQNMNTYLKIRNNEKYATSNIAWIDSATLDRMISMASITNDYKDLNGVVRELEGASEKTIDKKNDKKKRRKKRNKRVKPEFVSLDNVSEPDTIESLQMDENVNVDGETINVINNFGTDDSE